MGKKRPQFPKHQLNFPGLRGCECGCGDTPNPGRRFITGHNAKTPEMRAAVANRNRGKVPSAETLAKYSAARKGKSLSPETRAKISAKNKGRIFSAEWRANIGKTSKGRVHSPETRAKMSAAARKGPDHPAWTGGKGLYPLDWNKIARNIRKRDGGLCLLCGTKNFTPWKGADVHHLDEDKFHTDPSNLISLCRTCHKIVQWHMDEYTPRLRAILSERYGYVYD